MPAGVRETLIRERFDALGLSFRQMALSCARTAWPPTARFAMLDLKTVPAGRVG